MLITGYIKEQLQSVSFKSNIFKYLNYVTLFICYYDYSNLLLLVITITLSWCLIYVKLYHKQGYIGKTRECSGFNTTHILSHVADRCYGCILALLFTPYFLPNTAQPARWVGKMSYYVRQKAQNVTYINFLSIFYLSPRIANFGGKISFRYLFKL